MFLNRVFLVLMSFLLSGCIYDKQQTKEPVVLPTRDSQNVEEDSYSRIDDTNSRANRINARTNSVPPASRNRAR